MARRTRTAGVLAVLAVLAACSPDAVDPVAVEAVVAEDLAERGVTVVTVACPPGERPVEVGDEFTCTVTAAGGATVEVSVRQEGEGRILSRARRGLLDGEAVNAQIAGELRQRLAADVVVSCPAGVAANTGTTFSCPVSDSFGGSGTVEVTVTDDAAGTFEFVLSG